MVRRAREPRTWFADVWLLPDIPAYNGEPLWVTVDALLAPGFADYAEDHIGLSEMGDASFHMDVTKLHLVVRAHGFDLRECVEWMAQWLKVRG